MKEHPKFLWDYFSDQPHTLKDKKFKNQLYKKGLWQFFKSSFCLPLLPPLILTSFFRKQAIQKDVRKGIGLAVHVESDLPEKKIVSNELLRAMVEELGVNQLIVRIPLANIDQLDIYLKHIDNLMKEGREIVVNILQCRLLLDQPKELEKALLKVFSAIKNKVQYIQVGNAYNRRKWGFIHFGEYHDFFQLAQKCADQVSPHIKLIGGSVIDFELPPFLESLFNLRQGRPDEFAAQLYVDRRGAPENTQGGFNFLRKINLVQLMLQSSWKCAGRLWITEFNWPLKETGAFAPCKGSALVSEEDQANFLARSYLIALASGRVRTCYWHQLVAPGYGLIDNRNGKIKKRPSYFAFKALNALYNQATIKKLHIGDYLNTKGLYCVEATSTYDNKPVDILALWSIKDTVITEQIKADRFLNQKGENISPKANNSIEIGSSVIYCLTF